MILNIVYHLNEVFKLFSKEWVETLSKDFSFNLSHKIRGHCNRNDKSISKKYFEINSRLYKFK